MTNMTMLLIVTIGNPIYIRYSQKLIHCLNTIIKHEIFYLFQYHTYFITHNSSLVTFEILLL